MTAADPAREPPAKVRVVNKTGACLHLALTRYQFDRLVAEGLPVVEAASHKGGEWRVDLDAADDWLCARAAAAAAAKRRYWERVAAERREMQRQVAAMSDAQRARILRGR